MPSPGRKRSSPTPAGPTAADLFSGPGPTSALMREFDWTATPLGPVQTWPPSLVQTVRITFPSRMPMLIWWGSELIQLYNDAYSPLAGDKHPESIGQPAKQCWAEAWDELGPLADRVMLRGEATFAENMLLLLDRHGYLEETYWTFSYSPIRDAGSSVVGVFVSAAEVTTPVVSTRRLETVRQLGTVSAANSGSVEETCKAMVRILSDNRQAVPFAAIYLIDPDELKGQLVASYGIGEASALTPADEFGLGEHPDLANAVASGARGLVTGLRDSAPPSAFTPGPLGDEVPDSAMLLPVSVTGQSRPTAVAVLGVNPYRAIDDVYLTFFQLVARQLRVALSDALAYESEHQRADTLAELDEDKTRFYQNVSHEFRTPLTLIQGPLGTVLQEAGPELSTRHRESLLVANRAALRLRKLVDGLLEFSRVDADESHAQFETTDLAALTADLASMFRSVVEQAGLGYIVDVSAVSRPVEVDREMWAEIVLNLLSNAVKFTRKGRIEVQLRTVGDRIELAVSDTGVGIPLAHLPKVFERFTQVPGQSGRSAEGAGIGLALVAALAATHGGEVDVHSVHGEGSRFSVTIPVTAPPERAGAQPGTRVGESAVNAYVLEAESWLSAAPVAEPAPGPVVSLGRLLVVEDNADLRSYLVRLLAADGWAVDAVGSVDAALQVDPPPEIVVSDVMLPGRSGLDLTRLMRADEALRRIPIILLTARRGPDAAAEGLQAGADDYVAKPFEPGELLARIRVHHELARLRDFALSEAENRATNLHRALASNRQIGVAIGVLMAQDKITEEEAFDRLREVSQRANRKLRDVADQVVLTGVLDAPPVSTEP